MRFLLIGLGALAFSHAAVASPCGDRIAKLQARFDAEAPAEAGTSVSGSNAAETAAAKLHHQPTPADSAAEKGSPDSATVVKRARFQNDIFRAQAADHSGDASGCQAAATAAEKDLAP